jgi:integrase
MTVAKAGKLWLEARESHGLERTTVTQYRQHLDLHLIPYIGGLKLAELTTGSVAALEDALRKAGRSPAMIRKIRTSLSQLLAVSAERGWVARNVVRDLMRTRTRGKEHKAEKRQKGKLKVGVDIPTPDEISAILAHAKGRWRALLLTAAFTGLRASELRGLRWEDVDLKGKRLHISQRADRYNKIGQPKSHAASRMVPFGNQVANTLREHKLACARSELDLVFPNKLGNVEVLGNIVRRGLWPAEIAAGVTKKGKPKYSGLHALRHFYASWCINRKADGGLELPPKTVQARMGHSSIVLTLDIYGHLFPEGEDTGELDAAELKIVTA